MTYREKTLVVSFGSTLLIFAFYLFRLWQMSQTGELEAQAVYQLWAVVIVVSIISSIAGNILTQIIFGIIEGIRTGKEEVSSLEDERDRLIGLKGDRNAYYLFSGGVFIAMITLVIGQPVMVMFNLLVIASMVGTMFGDASQLYLYRRGL